MISHLEYQICDIFECSAGLGITEKIQRYNLYAIKSGVKSRHIFVLFKGLWNSMFNLLCEKIILGVNKLQLRKLFIGLITVFLIILTGCSNGLDNKVQTYNDDQYIEVQKRVGKEYENNFNEFRKITDGKKVHKVKEILNELKWEYAKRDTLQPPDYQFIFQPKDPKIQVKAVSNKIWITPDKDRLVIGRGENQYAQLTKEQSGIIFEIITGDNLSKLK